MGTRKNPETSLEAYRGLDPQRMNQTYRAIVDALLVIGKGNYETIAVQAEMPEAKIWKRMGEAAKMGLIHNTGETIKTKNGYKSYLFAIGPAPETVQKKQRVMKGKTVSDFSKAIKQVSQTIHKQDSLF
jgi:hypothetical protein